MSIASGKGLWAHVEKAARVFCHKVGMHMTLGKNDISMQTLQDSMRFAALLSITERADQIAIIGEESVSFAGGDSGTTFKAGSITDISPGEVLHNTATNSLTGAKGMEVSSVESALAPDYSGKFQVTDKDTGKILAHKNYRIKTSQGKYYHGVTDKDGYTQFVGGAQSDSYDVEIES